MPSHVAELATDLIRGSAEEAQCRDEPSATVRSECSNLCRPALRIASPRPDSCGPALRKRVALSAAVPTTPAESKQDARVNVTGLGGVYSCARRHSAAPRLIQRVW